MTPPTEGGDWERPLAVERQGIAPVIAPTCHRCGMSVVRPAVEYLTFYRNRGAHTCEPCADAIKAEIEGHHPTEVEP